MVIGNLFNTKDGKVVLWPVAVYSLLFLKYNPNFTSLIFGLTKINIGLRES